MQTECSPTLFEFEPVERRNVVAGFDGGIITSDAGGLLLYRKGVRTHFYSYHTVKGSEPIFTRMISDT